MSIEYTGRPTVLDTAEFNSSDYDTGHVEDAYVQARRFRSGFALEQ
jgi:hypothetical protein